MTDDDTINQSIMEVAQLVIAQADRMKQLKGILTNFKRDGGVKKTKSYYAARLEKIKCCHTEFHTDHRALLATGDTDHEYFQNDSVSLFDQAYFEVYCALVDDREERLGVSTVDNATAAPVNSLPPPYQSAVHVPNIPLASFSGQFVDWLPFHDAYVRLVKANSALNVMQKFHLLKEAIPKDRDVDIHHMSLTDENFNAAWDLMVKRYENPRVIFMNLMNGLYALPSQTKECSTQIKALLSAASVFVHGVKRWEIPIEACNHWLAHFLSTKLSVETHQAWERHLGSCRTIPTFEQFESFLNDRLIELDAIENRHIGNSSHKAPRDTSKPNYQHKYNDSRPPNRSDKKAIHAFTRSDSTNSSRGCACCSALNHNVRNCSVFRSKDYTGRKSVATQKKLCYNCLSTEHIISRCDSKRNCNICGHRHHTLLHVYTNASGSSQAPTNSVSSVSSAIGGGQSANASNSSVQQQQVHTHTSQIVLPLSEKSSPGILLATALVQMVNPATGQATMVRAFFDGGSTGTVISERIVQSLGLRRYAVHTEITGVGTSRQSSSEATSFTLRSYLDPDFTLFVESALVLRKVTAPLPTQRITPQQWAHIQGLSLADPTYFQSGRIDLLIGSELAASILLPEQRIASPAEPMAQNSHFGWLLSGKTSHASSDSSEIQCHHISAQSNELETMVRSFFDCEQVNEKRSRSEEEQWVVEFFKRTHIRKANGKYEVRLPFKSYRDDSQVLGKSQQLASGRFRQLERRLNRNPGLRERYYEGIQEYFDLHQIKRAFSTEEQHTTSTNDTLSVTSCVLPHHAVVKEDSLTTKLRIVFDASSKTSNGRSLNDILHIGPSLQNDLAGVIINWRAHPYVFTADIQKMYRCIDMHPEDAQYQRILWYDENGDPQPHILETVTFGTASAPCTAILVMHQIAEDERERFPLAESVLKDEIYVDDIQTGGDTIEKTLKIRNDVIGALRSAGMELRKWASNDTRILAGIPPEHQSNSQALTLHNQDSIKILGMCWVPNDDCFRYQLKFTLPTENTKRSILSTIARLYDPLGYIAPIVVAAKIILRDVWATAVDWDVPVSPELQAQWHNFASALPAIGQIAIPRWIDYASSKSKSVQLHVFCDGSSSAYAAAAYIRVQNHSGEVHTHLVASKNKVTSASALTIPKIELNGAELAVRLANWVKSQFHINIERTYFWSDATIILHWIHGDASRWKTFVANRITKIQASSQPKQWNHVSTKENPADCATRGLSPHQLKVFDLWWHGPQWLADSEENWPKFNAMSVRSEGAEEEMKPTSVRIHVNITTESLLTRYSSYQRLIRVNARIQRYIYNLSAKRSCTSDKPLKRRSGPLLVSELNHSLLQIVRMVQGEAFHSELALIQANEPLPKKCKISGLAPFVENGLLRVRGRLQRSSLAYQQKHPLILPSSHHFTKLVIEDSHNRTLHGGAQLVLSHTRQQFWIVDGRRTVQANLRKCVTCFKRKPETSSQLMGNLPYHRVNQPQRPFLASGVDYTGAFEVKASRFRGNTTYKAYVAIFICLATKAVHLEAVTGMSTKHFIWALQRFTGRRGVCKDMYSDNGTNFIGADRELKTTVIPFVEGVEKHVIPELSKNSIQWHFNPPHSPNFGGLWEANIRSMKHHLHRVLDSSHLTYEELSTVLVRIESMLNSRPLCTLTMDPDDLDMLTPGHFLIGAPLLSLPETPDLSIAIHENYVAIQQMMQQFWKRWSSDWLSHLQQRPKWHKVRPNLQINDIVIIRDDRLRPSEWLVGRIIEIHPGMDKLVRVATVRTKNGIYKRSVTKLCRLPIPNELNPSTSWSTRDS